MSKRVSRCLHTPKSKEPHHKWGSLRFEAK